MLLKTKLYLGFLAVLLLTISVGGIGWRGMYDMGVYGAYSTAIEKAMSHLSLAEASMLRFMLLGKDDLAAETDQHLDAALSIIEQTEENLPEEWAIEDGKALVEQLDSFKTAFAQLVSSARESEAMKRRLDDNADAGAKAVEELDAMLGAALAQRPSPATAQDYRRLHGAASAFAEVRVQTGMFLTQPTDERRAAIRALIADARKQLTATRDRQTDEAVRSAVQRLLGNVGNYSGLFGIYSRQLLARFEALERQQQVVAAAQAAASSAMEHAKTAAQASSRMALLLLAGGVLTATLIGACIALLLPRSTVRQLGKDPGELAAIARRVTEGSYEVDDGSPRVGVYSHIIDMVKALQGHIANAKEESRRAQEQSDMARAAKEEAEAARASVEDANKTMQSVADEAHRISTRIAAAAEELSAQADQVGAGAKAQQQRMVETLTAVTQMNAAVADVAASATATSRSAGDSRRHADEGAGIVGRTVAAIDRVAEGSEAVRRNMQELGRKADAIGAVMEMIAEIADQTNLLALNAAIEAARAGDAGRGFAVVADEVRKLAERTMQATTEVDGSVRGIQDVARRNVAAVEAAVTAVGEATNCARESGRALSEIVRIVGESAVQVNGIATAAEEQSAACEQIERTMQAVSDIATETAKGMQQSTVAIRELSEMATQLEQALQRLHA